MYYVCIMRCIMRCINFNTSHKMYWMFVGRQEKLMNLQLVLVNNEICYFFVFPDRGSERKGHIIIRSNSI